MKAVVAAFNQEKALVGAFSVINRFAALKRISTSDNNMMLQVNLSETWAETEDVFGQPRLEVRQTSNMVDKVIQTYLAQYL